MAKRVSLCVVLAVLLSTWLSMNGSALTAQDFMDGGRGLNSEKQEVERFLTEEKASLPVSSPLNLEGAYKVYGLLNPDIVDTYKKQASIRDVISDEYKWQVPTENFDLVTVRKAQTANTWELVGVVFNDETDSMRSKVVNKSSLHTAISSRVKEISNLQYIDCPMYFTTFAYLESGGQEYLIPYSTRPDLTGLENGKMYTASDTVAILYTNFGERVPDYNGGIAPRDTVPQKESAPPSLWIMAGFAVFGVGAGCVFLLKKSIKMKRGKK